MLKLNSKNKIFFEEREIKIVDIESIFNSDEKNLILEIDKNSDIYFFNKIMKELKKKILKKYLSRFKKK